MTDAATPADVYECTQTVLDVTPEAAIVSNLGTASFVLNDVADRPENFPLTGAMGVTTPIGFGLAMAIDAPVAVLDGDGSLLMSLGSLATVAEYDPSNLTIVVWDNGTFQTTGGQPTLSRNVDFAAIARECGLAAWDVANDRTFEEAYEAAVAVDGAALVSCRVEPVSPEDYPPLDYSHSHVKHRFREAVRGR